MGGVRKALVIALAGLAIMLPIPSHDARRWLCLCAQVALAPASPWMAMIAAWRCWFITWCGSGSW